MKKITLVSVLAVLCLYAAAQEKPLAIGDAVPDITFTNLVNYPTQTARLSDFKGKLVILDFWATWCGSCIAAFPKLQKLQEGFKNDLQVLMVATHQSGDDAEKINSILTRLKKNNKAVKLPVTINDIAPKLFPHTGLPHYVWIGKEGRVLAVTRTEEVTLQNISAAISGKPLNVAQKKDYDKRNLYGLDTSLVSQEKTGSYAVVVKGRTTNLHGGGGFIYFRKKDGATRGLFFANSPLFALYTRIASSILDDFDNDFARIQFNPADSNFLDCWRYPDTDSLIRWSNQNAYSLDFYGAPGTSRELFKKALWLLNDGTPFNAATVSRKTSCLVLRRIDSSRESGSKQYTTIQYKGQERTIAISDIKSMYKGWLNRSMPFVDRTGLKDERYFKPDQYPLTITDAQKILSDNNLKVAEEQLELPVMVITRKPKF